MFAKTLVQVLLVLVGSAIVLGGPTTTGVRTETKATPKTVSKTATASGTMLGAAFSKHFASPPVVQDETLPILSPYDLLRVAVVDAKVIQARRSKYTRYLTMGHEPLAVERLKLWQGATWVLNHLSKSPILVAPVILETPGGPVIRVQLDDYGIDPKAWDDFAEQGSGPVAEARVPEPYFHVYQEKALYKDVEREVDCEPYTQNGQRYTKKRVIERVFDKKTVQFDTLPALAQDGGALITELIAITGSKSPLIRADWFVYYASQAPAYYDLLGLGKTLKEIEEFANVDEKRAEKRGAAVWGVVINSKVAFHNRRLRGYRIVAGPRGGAFWISDDVLASFTQRDYLANLLGEFADAHEIIFTLPNGLQGYAITDGNGKRLDVVNAVIALDRETRLVDKNLGIRNCMTCHLNGMRDVTDEVRALGNPRITLNLPDDGGVSATRVRDLFYSIDINLVAKQDSDLFGIASVACNGITAPANGANLEYLFRKYWDGWDEQAKLNVGVTLQQLANELGVEPEKLVTVVQQALIQGKTGNVASTAVEIQLDGLTRTPSRPLVRSQAEKIYANASLLTIGGKR